MTAQGSKPRENEVARYNVPKRWRVVSVRRLEKSGQWCIEADVKGLLLRSTKRRQFVGSGNTWSEVSSQQDAPGQKKNVINLGAPSRRACVILLSIVAQHQSMQQSKQKHWPVPIRTRQRLKVVAGSGNNRS